MALSKQRLVADPSIGVADLQECIEAYLDLTKDNNLLKHLCPPPGVSWKSSPDPNWLCKHSDLWKLYFAKAQNGVLPAKKHRTALQKLQDKREMNFTTKPKKSIEEYADTVDEWVRIGLAHLRTLKQSSTARARAMRKLDSDQMDQLQGALDLIIGLQEEDESQTFQLVAVNRSNSRDSETLEEPTPSPPTRDSKNDPKEVLMLNLSPKVVDPYEVFRRVLKRPSIHEDDKTQDRKTQKGVASVTAVTPETKRKVHSPTKLGGFLDGLINVGAVTKDELGLLNDINHQKPINQGFKSQLSRSNKLKKKLEQDEEPEEEEEEEDEEEDDEDQEEGSKSKVQKKKKTASKTAKNPKKTKSGCKNKKPQQKSVKKTKPEESSGQGEKEDSKPKKVAMKKKVEKTKDKKKTENLEESKATDGMEQSKEEEEEAPGEKEEQEEIEVPKYKVPEGMDANLNRAKNRNKYCSRFYYQAFNVAKKEGKEKEECQVAGRQAHAVAGAEFDEKIWPRSKDVDWVWTKSQGKKGMDGFWGMWGSKAPNIYMWCIT